jgi:hypothetical protein
LLHPLDHLAQVVGFKWVYDDTVEFSLKAPVSVPDGTLVERTQGTPQGSIVSPTLANQFLHYAFERWMTQHYPDIPFERYADDAICHCVSAEQARALKDALAQWLARCRLELHGPLGTFLRHSLVPGHVVSSAEPWTSAVRG